MSSNKKLAGLSDKELDALDADLAKQRTAIRLQQRDVEIERQIRAATVNLSPDAKAALGIHVAGEVNGNGGAESKKT